MKAEWQNMALALNIVVGLLCYVAWLTDAPFTDSVKLGLLFVGSGIGLAICTWIAKREMSNPTSLAWRSPTPQRARWGQRLLLVWTGGFGAVLVSLEWLLPQLGVNARLAEQIVLLSFGSLMVLGLFGVWYWSRSGE